MMGPRRAAETFDSYIFLMASAVDVPSLTEAHRQAQADDRLTLNQKAALESVFVAHSKLLLIRGL